MAIVYCHKATHFLKDHQSISIISNPQSLDEKQREDDTDSILPEGVLRIVVDFLSFDQPFKYNIGGTLLQRLQRQITASLIQQRQQRIRFSFTYGNKWLVLTERTSQYETIFLNDPNIRGIARSLADVMTLCRDGDTILLGPGQHELECNLIVRRDRNVMGKLSQSVPRLLIEGSEPRYGRSSILVQDSRLSIFDEVQFINVDIEWKSDGLLLELYDETHSEFPIEFTMVNCTMRGKGELEIQTATNQWNCNIWGSRFAADSVSIISKGHSSAFNLLSDLSIVGSSFRTRKGNAPSIQFVSQIKPSFYNIELGENKVIGGGEHDNDNEKSQ